MKYIITLTLLLSVLSCSTNNGELKIDSSKAKNALKTELKLEEKDVAKEIHYWQQYDSSSTASFKTDSSTIARVIKRFRMKPDTSFKYLWIPEESPGWFGPSIDKSDKRFNTWIKEYSDRKLFIQTNEFNNQCFYANLKW